MTGRVNVESRVDIENSSAHFSASLSSVRANIRPVVATGQPAAIVRVVQTIDGTLKSLMTQNATIGIRSNLKKHKT